MRLDWGWGRRAGFIFAQIMAVLLVGCFGLLSRAAMAEGPVRRAALLSYVAQYQLSLLSARPDSGITSAEGWMMSRIEEKCQGWNTKDEFYLVLSAVDQPDHVIATKSTGFEAKSGLEYQFRTDHWHEDGSTDQLSGKAVLDRHFHGSVTYKQPKADKITLKETIFFPTRFMIDVLQAAAANKSFYQAHMFDGSGRNGGMLTTVAIGSGQMVPPLAPDKAGSQPKRDRLGEKQPGEKRWPISMAMFDIDRPSM